MIRLPLRPRRLTAALVVVLTAAALPAGPAPAQQSTPEAVGDTPFDAEERQEIRRLVREYILDNPEVIMEAVQILQERRRQEAESQRKQALQAHAEALRDPGALPVLGNPDGDVTVVEFFDYRCPYCQRLTDMLLETVEEDGNVRLVLKEYPILSEASEVAARAAIAAAQQGRYAEFHRALMTDIQTVNRNSVLRLAEMMGLDVQQLKADMDSETVTRTLQKTRQLGQALQISGTPAFVIGDTVVPGALDRARLEELIAQARDKQG
jgi:protein-disulfide isomerase